MGKKVTIDPLVKQHQFVHNLTYNKVVELRELETKVISLESTIEFLRSWRDELYKKICPQCHGTGSPSISESNGSKCKLCRGTGIKKK